MIPDITYKENIGPVLDYHFKKIGEGNAELVDAGVTMENTRDTINIQLETTMESNLDVVKNKYLHMSLSFNHEDVVNSETMVNVGTRYLEELGYANNPSYMFRHFDTKHEHLHIVVPTVDFDGKKIDEWKLFRRSADIALLLEREFGLVPTEILYDKDKQLKGLSELARQDRYLSNYLIKIKSRSEQEFKSITKGWHPELIDFVSKENPRYSEIITHPNYEEGDIDPVEASMGEKSSLKELLLQDLDQVHKNCNSKESFLERLEDRGIYARALGSKMNYGYPDVAFYVTEKSLPAKFRYDFLFQDRKVEFGQEKQLEFVRRQVERALLNSSSKEEFLGELNARGIAYDATVDKRGISGIKYSSLNIENPIQFAGGKLNKSLTWGNIKKKLGIEKEDLVKEKGKKAELAKGLAPGAKSAGDKIARGMDTSGEDEELNHGL